MKPLRRVAVLGAGTMGSRIAAHLANAGFPVDLLDIVRPEAPGGASPSRPNRNAAAIAGIESAAKQKPVAFMTEAARALITPGNFEDDLARIANCQWIIEAVAENLEIKRALWSKVASLREPDAICSTNTSGIPLATISDGFEPGFRSHFLGTHFFNPPRYLHLVEVIPGADTLPEILDWISGFCDLHLGKGVVRCKDTPNFIANRIGCFFGAKIHQLTEQLDLTIEEVDALTGPLIGLPKSASFRLIDIIGVDVWVHVLRNLYEAAPHDPARDLYVVPPVMQALMDRGWLGEKSGQGFYKRVGKGAEKEIWALDRKTLEYHPVQKVRFTSVEAARPIEDLAQRLRALSADNDRAGQFIWQLFRDFFLYTARMIPEISDRVVEIDRAMRWGFAFQKGPFELWDALGVGETVARMRREGCEIPATIERMMAEGARNFYEAADRDGRPGTKFYDLANGGYCDREPRPGVTMIRDLKRVRGTVHYNPGASLVDLGDGALCLEFHSKMNSLGEDAVQMIYAGLDALSLNFQALVIANDGENFSVGANLMMVLLAAQEGEWDELDRVVRRFQQAGMALKYSPRPVVSAPFGMTLGGGCEIAMSARRIQAAAETYMGLVETGVGLIPAGGGCKEMLLRLGNLKHVFELIGYAKVSESAPHARTLGFSPMATRSP